MHDESSALGGAPSMKKTFQDTNTFVTGLDSSSKARLEFNEGDITKVFRWQAHTDCINWISYIEELDCISSCSFDCNVYIWNTEC